MAHVNPVSDEILDIESYRPRSGRIIGEDGRVYNLVDFLLNFNLGGGTGGGESGGSFFKSVPTYDDLPQPADAHKDELYFVQESTGGAFSILGAYKYPRGFYAANADGEWEQVPLSVAVSEDAFTVVNISDWTAFRAYVKNINPLDVVLYDGIFYQNLTGILTDEPPVNDQENWIVFQGGQGNDGKSAFELAVENGFVGDEAAWLASLKGANGEQGTLLFTITGTTTTAPAGARVGDYIFNGSTTSSYNVGNRALSPGFQAAITQLSPLQISATMTQYRGLTGGQGIQGIQGFKGDPGSALTEVDYIVSTSEELEGLNNNPNAKCVMIKAGEYRLTKALSLHGNVKRIFGSGDVTVTFELAANTSGCLRGNRYNGVGNAILQTVIEGITICVVPASPTLTFTVLSGLCVRNCTVCAGRGLIGSYEQPLPARYTMMSGCNNNANVLVKIPAMGKGALTSIGLYYCFNNTNVAVVFESIYFELGSGQLGNDDAWLGCISIDLTAFRQCTNIVNCIAMACMGIPIYYPGGSFTKFPGTISLTGFDSCNNIVGADTCFFVGDSYSSYAYAREFARYDYKNCDFLSNCKGKYDLLSGIMSHNTMASIPDDGFWGAFENNGWVDGAEYLQNYLPIYYQVTHKCGETCL